MARTRPDRAQKALEEAALALPSEICIRVQLEIQVVLACACYSVRDHAAARQTLERCRQWAEPPADCPTMQGQRRWVEGHLLNHEGETWRSLDCFADCVDTFLATCMIDGQKHESPVTGTGPRN